MDQQAIFGLSAACFGFASAVFFSLGVLRMTPKIIAIQADEPWKFAQERATALASQAADYSAGALLLVFSFALQVAATPGFPAILPEPCLARLDIAPVAVCALLAAFCIGGLLAFARRTWLSQKVKELLPT